MGFWRGCRIRATWPTNFYNERSYRRISSLVPWLLFPPSLFGLVSLRRGIYVISTTLKPIFNHTRTPNVPVLSLPSPLYHKAAGARRLWWESFLSGLSFWLHDPSCHVDSASWSLKLLRQTSLHLYPPIVSVCQEKQSVLLGMKYDSLETRVSPFSPTSLLYHLISFWDLISEWLTEGTLFQRTIATKLLYQKPAGSCEYFH